MQTSVAASLPYWHIATRLEIPRFRRFLRRALARGASSLLDAGSGSGVVSLLARDLGYRVTALDVRSEGLRQTRSSAAQSESAPPLKVLQADCMDLPCADASFDCLVSSHVIEHLNNPQRHLQEMNRVLKPGGHLLLSCPSTTHWYRFLKLSGIRTDPEDHKVTGYTARQLMDMLPASLVVKMQRTSLRLLGANFSDLQNVMSRITGIRANPVGQSSQTKGYSRRAPIPGLHFLRETILAPATACCRLEDLFLRFLPGTVTTLEIVKKDIGEC